MSKKCDHNVMIKKIVLQGKVTWNSMQKNFQNSSEST